EREQVDRVLDNNGYSTAHVQFRQRVKGQRKLRTGKSKFLLEARVQQTNVEVWFGIAQTISELELAFVGADRGRREHNVKPFLQQCLMTLNEFRIHGNGKFPNKQIGARACPKVRDDLKQAFQMARSLNQPLCIGLKPVLQGR